MLDEAERHTEVEMVETYMTCGVLVGSVAGIFAGLVTGRMSMCFGIGLFLGLIVGICFKKKPRSK